MVERACAAGGAEPADKHRDEYRSVRESTGGQDHAGDGGQYQQHHDLGLGERDIVTDDRVHTGRPPP